MTIDLSEFRSARGPKACKIGKLVEKLSKEDTEKFQAALEAKDITSLAITTWLELKTGQRTHQSTLRLHRTGGCNCD